VRAGKRKARGDEKLPGGGGRKIALRGIHASRGFHASTRVRPRAQNAVADHGRSRAETRSKAIRRSGSCAIDDTLSFGANCRLKLQHCDGLAQMRRKWWLDIEKRPHYRQTVEQPFAENLTYLHQVGWFAAKCGVKNASRLR
jgi:hypothetical protein